MGLCIESAPLNGSNTTFWAISSIGSVVGKVTSAVYSPRLEKNIALAMVAMDCTDIGIELMIAMPDEPVGATAADRPFFDPKKQIVSG